MTGNLGFALDGARQVLVYGLLLGAGIPLVFALGVRALALGAGGEATTAQKGPHPAGKVLAGICFALVIAAVAIGITVIVAAGFGKAVSFEHVYPTLVAKE